MRKKLGRNDPCPCGSGKKYKMCCLRNLRNVDSLPQKFRFEAGSYGDVGAIVPSIACVKLAKPDEWNYYFVLVNPQEIYPHEDDASSHAGRDLEAAFLHKESKGSKEAVAEYLNALGYVSVEGFKMVKEQSPLA